MPSATAIAMLPGIEPPAPTYGACFATIFFAFSISLIAAMLMLSGKLRKGGSRHAAISKRIDASFLPSSILFRGECSGHRPRYCNLRSIRGELQAQPFKRRCGVYELGSRFLIRMEEFPPNEG